ncbi:hypothetical protein [Sphingomonas sp. CLY1604]|uniref:hypothetical protein n=1 Tax=Sphingomonas sp. CLY1604 TaxID=3457786 RepID=UPI003FD8300F
MKDQQQVDRLLEHQAGIRANMDRAARLLAIGGAPDMAGLARLRWELVRLLAAYQMFKHREIFDPHIAGGSADRARTARALKVDCLALGEEVRRFVARHSSGAVESPEVYRAEALAFIARMRGHLDYERRAAAALLACDAPGRPIIPPPPGWSLRRDRPTPAG